MKTDIWAEVAKRYGMTPAGLERLLVELGWMVEGAVSTKYVQDGRLTPLAEGFLDGLFVSDAWRREHRQGAR
jgi:hypothetical protein